MPAKRLLLIGPQPPPWDGTSVKFHTFVEFAVRELSRDVVDVVDCYIGDKTRMPLFSFKSFTGYARILAEILGKGCSADIIVLFGSQRFGGIFGSALSAMCRLIGKRFYISLFGGAFDVFLDELPRPLKSLLKTLFGYAGGIIVETRHLQRALACQWPGRVHYVPNFRQLRSTCERSEPRDPGSVRFLYVGQIRPEKGIEDLLVAFNLLEESLARAGHQISISLDLYGSLVKSLPEPSYLQRIQQQPNIHVHGEISHAEVLEAYGRADVFVFPSHSPTEGHSGALIEALMHGLPVVATSWRATPELVQHNKNGLLCPSHDPGTLAASMELLSRDVALRARLAQGARESVGEFDSERACSTMLKIILG